MLNIGSKKRAVDRRMSEVVAEEAAVANDIKALSRALRKDPEKVKMPPLKTMPAQGLVDGAPAELLEEQLMLGSETALGWASPSDGEEIPVNREQGQPLSNQPPLEDGLLPSDLKGTENGRFTSYFGAGSIKAARPLRQEKSVQRNKAIFMVVLVLLGTYIVLQIVL